MLDNHPWFEVVLIAASERSAEKCYIEAVQNRWKFRNPIPKAVQNLIVRNSAHIQAICDEIDFTFCAVDMKKDEAKILEEKFAQCETPVISCNSANRMIPDVPMVIPEINPDHIAIIQF